MFHPVLSTAILFFFLAFDVQALLLRNSTLEPTEDTSNFSIKPPLTDFLNATELNLLEKSVPQEQIEWINATLDSPWSSNRESQKDNRRTRSLVGKLSRRYVDVTRCSDSQRRVVMRSEIHTVMRMILDAQMSLSLSHPIWRALISPAFVEEPRALERMKGLFKVLYDFMSDPRDTVTLSCNFATPQCLKTRKVAGDGRQQVPAAYYGLNENIVNLCNKFFSMPQFEDLECKEGTPMSYYSAMRKQWFIFSPS